LCECKVYLAELRQWKEAADRFRILSAVDGGKLQVGPIDAVKFPNHSQKICLSTKQLSHNDSCALPQSLPAQMFTGEHALRLDELFVKLRERQLRRQHSVLDVKQAVIARGEAA
jgi:hypothetical protein